MSTHDFVYQTFVIYLFVKAMIFLPLAWVAALAWWSEQNESSSILETEASQG
jgi:hypothetical protein